MPANGYARTPNGGGEVPKFPGGGEVPKLPSPKKPLSPTLQIALAGHKIRETELVERAKGRRQEIFIRGTGATKTWVWFGAILLLILFIISPAALGFLQILSQIPEWLMYAIIGMFVLIFLLKRRK